MIQFINVIDDENVERLINVSNIIEFVHTGDNILKIALVNYENYINVSNLSKYDINKVFQGDLSIFNQRFALEAAKAQTERLRVKYDPIYLPGSGD